MSTCHDRCLSGIVAGIALLASGLGLAQGQEPTRKEPLPQIARSYVKKATFHLPLNIAENTKAQIREVQLYCKNSTTDSWVLLDKCPPNQTGFNFQADRDGEYWFTMTVVDKAGNSIPAHPEQSLFRMAVTVDKQPPTAEVRFMQAANEGQIVHVDVRDANLDQSKIHIYYQTKDKLWRLLDPSPQQANRYCIPIQAATTGLVRVSAADLAGNSMNREYDLNRSSVGQQVPESTGESVKVAASPAPAVPTENPRTNDSSLPPPFTNDPAPGATAPGARTDIPTSVPVPTATGPAPGTIEPNAKILQPLPTGSGDMDGTGTVIQAGGIGSTNRVQGAESSTKPDVITIQTEPVLPVVAPQGIPPIPEARPISVVNTIKSQPEASVSVKVRAPASVDRKLINHVQVLLAYKVEEVGSSGVGKVEVWITRDQSKTWQKFCEDPHCKSPMAIELPGEGLYGITLVVSNGRGFGGTPPNAGDAPDAWVEVDLTRPVAELTSVRPGTGADSGAVFINWSARDRNLSADSVELYYSSTRDGNWQPISKGLKNEGNHRWVPPVSVGQHCFLRLVIRDLAGNTTVVETPQAVSVDDLSRPRGRLVGILPYTPEIRLDPMGN